MDPSDEVDVFEATLKYPSVKLISIHYGQYVDAGVSSIYDCGNRRWERYMSRRWIVAGNS